MRKQIGRMTLALAAAVLLLALLCAMPALAEESLRVTLSVSPTALVGPGEVKVTLSLENTGYSTLEDISLNAQTGRNYNFTDIDPGDKKSFKLDNFPINEYQLGEPIDFVFSYTEDLFQKQYVTQMTVTEKIAKPDLSFTREASALAANTGDEITLTYTLKNSGDVDLYNIDITDEISQTPIAQGLFLAVGEKVKTVPYTFTMEKTVQSVPKLVAQSEGGDLNLTIEPIQIKLTQPFIDVIVTKIGADENGTKLDITLNNTGNVPITALTLTDETGAIIADSFSLDSGKGKSFAHEVPKSPTARQFGAKVVGSIEGEAATKVEFSSEQMQIPPIIAQDEVGLTVNVTADQTALQAPGMVNVTIALNNTGSAELVDLVVSEAIAGTIKNVDRLPPAQAQQTGTESMQVALQFNQSSNLNIIVTAKDVLGNAYTFEAQSLHIEVAPQATPPPQEVPNGISWTMWLFIGVGILLALCIVALIAVLLREKRHKQRNEEAQDAMELLNRKEDEFEKELYQAPRTARQPRVMGENAGKATAKQPAKPSAKQAGKPKQPSSAPRAASAKRHDGGASERYEQEYDPLQTLRTAQRFVQDRQTLAFEDDDQPGLPYAEQPAQRQGGAPRKRPVLKREQPHEILPHSQARPLILSDDAQLPEDDVFEDEFLDD